MIEVRGLNKFFGPVHVLRDVEFSVGKGELLGFLGLNGAGKTTTMRILTGYFPATSGTARVAGYDVFEQSMQVRRNTGYLPESVPLYTDMPVQSYLRFVADIKGVARGQIRSQVGAAIEQTGLQTMTRRLIGNLSKGYRQRVGLAQALLGDPRVLVLDEPTEGLDPSQRREIRQLIRNMAGDRTVILSTHILPEVAMTCSRVVIIHRGRVVADENLGQLEQKSRDSGNLIVRVAGQDATAALAAVPGVHKVEPLGLAMPGQREYQLTTVAGQDLRAAVARAVVGAGIDLLELTSPSPTLEDIFVRLTSSEADANEAAAEGVVAPGGTAVASAGKEEK